MDTKDDYFINEVVTRSRWYHPFALGKLILGGRSFLVWNQGIGICFVLNMMFY